MPITVTTEPAEFDATTPAGQTIRVAVHPSGMFEHVGGRTRCRSLLAELLNDVDEAAAKAAARKAAKAAKDAKDAKARSVPGFAVIASTGQRVEVRGPSQRHSWRPASLITFPDGKRATWDNVDLLRDLTDDELAERARLAAAVDEATVRNAAAITARVDEFHHRWSIDFTGQAAYDVERGEFTATIHDHPYSAPTLTGLTARIAHALWKRDYPFNGYKTADEKKAADDAEADYRRADKEFREFRDAHAFPAVTRRR